MYSITVLPEVSIPQLTSPVNKSRLLSLCSRHIIPDPRFRSYQGKPAYCAVRGLPLPRFNHPLEISVSLAHKQESGGRGDTKMFVTFIPRKGDRDDTAPLVVS